tara:strand:- start:82 stop:1026 length:945 start_codon:yes stop_codon:yes gene_type:complete
MIIRQAFKPDTFQKNPLVKWGLVQKDPRVPRSLHGKPKLSASAFNSWAENPTSFITSYILKLKSDPSQAMMRGNVAEDILYKVLMNTVNYDDIDKECEKLFRHKTAMIGEEKERVKEIKDLNGYKTYGAMRKDGTKPLKNDYKGYIKNAYDTIKVFKQPKKYQDHVWYHIEAFDCFADGWKDFSYDNFDLDLKTTAKMNSALPLNYRRQLAFYRMKDNRDQKLLLATKEKAELYILEDSYKQSKEEIYHIINTMFIALSECNSVEELLERYYPNWEFWKFNIKQKEELRKLINATHVKTWKERQEAKEFERGIS